MYLFFCFLARWVLHSTFQWGKQPDPSTPLSWLPLQDLRPAGLPLLQGSVRYQTGWLPGKTKAPAETQPVIIAFTLLWMINQLIWKMSCWCVGVWRKCRGSNQIRHTLWTLKVRHCSKNSPHCMVEFYPTKSEMKGWFDIFGYMFSHRGFLKSLCGKENLNLIHSVPLFLYVHQSKIQIEKPPLLHLQYDNCLLVVSQLNYFPLTERQSSTSVCT